MEALREKLEKALNDNVFTKPKGKLFNVVNTDTLIFDLKANREPFKLSLTTFTKKIECQYGTFRYCAKGTIKQHELYFIQKVKRYVLNLPSFPKIDRTTIRYVKNFMILNKRWTKELHEVDLSAAYWSIAYMDGHIYRELYEEGLKLSKKVRLVALGALAKRITIMYFDGDIFSIPEVEELHPSANIFFNAVMKTAALMNKAHSLTDGNTLFIWSDAIFFKGDKNLQRISDLFNKEKIAFKTFNIDSIKYYKYIATIKSKEFAEANKGEREEREFNFKVLDF